MVGITHIQNTFGQWSSVSYGVTETTGFSNRGIEKAVIFITEKLFDSYFNRYLETTCLHEAGHAIELRHTYEPGMGETDPEVIALMHPDPVSYTHLIYDFLWDIFCDWYIEISKARLQAGGEASLNVQKVLVYVMANTLKLLHPFMPFITEQIWQAIPNDCETIMLAKFPEYNLSLIHI